MGFTFDGTSSKDMGVATRMASEARVPELRNSTIVIAGKDGLLDLGATLSERVIEISCFIPPKKTIAELLSSKDAIVEWLNPDKGQCQLILDSEPDRVYFARLQSGITFERVVRASASFDLTFFCPDPYGYALVDEVFSFDDCGEHTITRTKGNALSNPVYYLQGEIPEDEDSYISIVTNGMELKISGASLVEDELLVVDSQRLTAWVEDFDGKVLRNALPYIDKLNFPVLKAGENSVSIEVSGEAVFTGLQIKANSRWR